MDIKRLLNEQRTKRGLTYEQVAQGIGCSSSYVFRVEKGARKKPSFEIVQRIIKFFDLSEEELKQYQKEDTSTISDFEKQKNNILRIIGSMNVDNFNEVVHLLNEIKKYQELQNTSELGQKRVGYFDENLKRQFQQACIKSIQDGLKEKLEKNIQYGVAENQAQYGSEE